uniref:hypothetical protein n=1 Tax=Persicitalea sp. TaxID=3100273 RepID=UPI00359420C6
RMQSYAKECRVEDLYYFIKNNRRLIENADSLISRIDEYRRTESDLARLKADPGNRTFVGSAYRSLIEVASQIPEVARAFKDCAARSYYEYLLESARLSEARGAESGDKNNYREAVGYLADARSLGLEPMKAALDEFQKRLSDKLDCEVNQEEFSKSATRVREALSNCRVAEAWAIWQPAMEQINGCGPSDAAFFGQYLNLRDMVQRFHTSDSLYTALKQKGDRAIESKQCGEAKDIVREIAALDLCDASQRDAALPIYAQRITECERTNCFLTARDLAFRSAENREWKASYDAYQQAYDCADESQKARIKQIMDDMKCDAYPDRCRKGNVATALQPTGRVGINNPLYFEDGLLKETNYGYFVSAGLQLSFLSYLNPLDVVIGAEYFRTKYKALGIAQGRTSSAGDFEVEGADISLALKLHKSNTDPNRLRPYLKGGIEILLPFGYSMTNHDKYESTNDRKFLKKQSLGMLGGLGVELQRKKFGFFVEAIFGYNFSGIYNSNVITVSGSRGKTESNFRTAGLRAGIRFW